MSDITPCPQPDACPFCGGRAYIELGKRGSCQLHGEPFQAVVVRCKKYECPAKPRIEAGDVYNGGEAKARREAIAAWNTRHPIRTDRAPAEATDAA